MSGLINKIKEKTTSSHHREEDTPQQEEQQFSIQPHPAKTNDPRDLQGGSGFQKDASFQAFHSHGPYIPDQSVVNNIEPPAVRFFL
ncbi:hypothetical protein QCA50_007136 [Cerrena zonata]|uniref:Uncharacterized protein n=1 Tax=Cerrena zonata TaxID=2478898 RepID=A0AAW0GDY1_9APHY